MSAFHDVRLPLSLAIGASGGPETATGVVRLASGGEQRSARWAGSRRRWEIGGATMRMDAAHELTTFFEARRGRLHGFRFRDPLDWKSCAPAGEPSALDQQLGLGDGETASFQIVKRYESGGDGRDRRITRPVAGTVVVAVDGEAADAFEVNLQTGVVTFEEAPPDGAVLTCGFCFDAPVRFDMERLEFIVEGFDAVRLVRASLVELGV
jgi:uncharacterized protein (TIGR02217 family)